MLRGSVRALRCLLRARRAGRHPAPCTMSDDPGRSKRVCRGNVRTGEFTSAASRSQAESENLDDDDLDEQAFLDDDIEDPDDPAGSGDAIPGGGSVLQDDEESDEDSGDGNNATWTNVLHDTLKANPRLRSQAAPKHTECASPLGYASLFLDPDTLRKIVEATNALAREAEVGWLDVTIAELQAFLAVHI